MNRLPVLRGIFTLVLASFLMTFQPGRVLALDGPPLRAQAGSAYALIEAVNAYRASYGLAAYGVDGGLMSLAQAQSDYQASIRTCTHERANGSSVGANGISAENVACGLNLSVEGAIYSQWTDALHNATMLGPDTGQVGAGVAVSGANVYYTLDVKRLSGEFIYRPPLKPTIPAGQPGATSGPTSSPQPLVVALATVTPLADGSIVHVIRYGQTLIGIAKAYGITLDQLYAANKKLDPKNPVYFEGQSLVIRLAFTPTVSPSPSPSPRPPTRTPVPTRTATLAPSLTPTLTLTPTPGLLDQVSQSLGSQRRTAAIVIILASALGIFLVILRGFGRKKT